MQLIAITVEEEEDIAKFKDYKPTSTDAAPASLSKEPSTPPPPPPKEEVPAESDVSEVPTAAKPSATPASDGCIFASQLARKITEDNNVPLSSIKGTGPDGLIVKGDIDDYLGIPSSLRQIECLSESFKVDNGHPRKKSGGSRKVRVLK